MLSHSLEALEPGAGLAQTTDDMINDKVNIRFFMTIPFYI
jgi:hypothetical protein